MAKRVIQRHHISYDPEITVDIFKGEHEILTKIERYTKKTVSRGFIKALKTWLALNENRGIELFRATVTKDGKYIIKGDK